MKFDPLSPDGRTVPQYAVGLSIVALVLALSFVPAVQVPTDTAVSLNIAGIALVGWLCGWHIAAVGALLWAVGRWLTSADHSWNAAGSLSLQTSVAIGLACWVAWLRVRWQRERRLARLDALTGVPNRQAFYERCAAELSRARRFHRPLTMALWDGDGFKAVNDQRGHAAGDRALQATAQSLARQIRQYDFLARLGGDEFVTLFPEIGSEEAAVTVQRLRQVLHAELGTQFSPLTYCVGVVTFLPGNWDVEVCLLEVDRVLYRAKRCGPAMASFDTVGPATPVENH